MNYVFFDFEFAFPIRPAWRPQANIEIYPISVGLAVYDFDGNRGDKLLGLAEPKPLMTYYAELMTPVIAPPTVYGFDWLKENVVPKLGKDAEAKPFKVVREELQSFIRNLGPQCWWSWYAAHDWVLLSQLTAEFFGDPKAPDMPMLCGDLEVARRLLNWTSSAITKGVAFDWPKHQGQEHHALEDAIQHMRMFRALHFAFRDIPGAPDVFDSYQRAFYYQPTR